MGRLKIIHPKAVVAPKYSISKRYVIESPSTLSSSTQLTKLTFKERLKVKIENIIEQCILTIQEYWYLIKAIAFGILFATTIAFTLILCQKNIDKKLGEPLQKVYNTVISEFNL